MKNFYEILEVPEDASQDEIKNAYKKKVKEYHPDHGGSSEKFIEIVEAYETLSDPNKRKDYDDAGKVKKDRNIHSIANRVIQTYFKKFLDTGDTIFKRDIILDIRKLLSIDEQRNKLEKGKLKNKIQFLEKIIERIERKGEVKHSPIEDLIKDEIEEYNRRLKQTRFQSLVNEIIVQILNDYNIRRDESA